MRILSLFRILTFWLSLLFLTNADLWSRGKEIVLEDYWYYVTHPDGKKVSIVSTRTGSSPRVEVIFSPDSSYVAYTADNLLGWEGQGRDLCYCKTDGSERTVILSSTASIRELNWVKMSEKQYIVFVQWALGFEGMGHVKVYDIDSKEIVFDTLGSQLRRIGSSAQLLVGDYPFSEKRAYTLDLEKIVPRASKFDSAAEAVANTAFRPCAYVSDVQTTFEAEEVVVGFIPEAWPHYPYNESRYIDLVPDWPEFTRVTSYVLSPNHRFVAFSATGKRFTCNGVIDKKTNKTYPLRFFLSSFDGEPCWSPNSQYVAFINLAGDYLKYINVFSMDSVLSFKYPMIAQTKFNSAKDKLFKICFSPDSDTLYCDVDRFGRGKVTTEKIIIRR
ncbi:MAG: hypothetical protein KAW52_00770 [candidate division Zixibacteria bacterium]|nr:hypothetical protein [candidate division Zixibacteria bacterium]